MKTKFILLALALGALGLTACTKKYYTEEITYVQGSKLESADFSVRANQWNVDQNYGYFYVQLNVSQITQDVVGSGAVQVVRKFDDGVWTPLPIVRAEITDAEGGGDYLFSTYIDYEWSLGKVTIYVTATDFYTGDAPGDIYFRVNIFR